MFPISVFDSKENITEPLHMVRLLYCPPPPPELLIKKWSLFLQTKENQDHILLWLFCLCVIWIQVSGDISWGISCSYLVHCFCPQLSLLIMLSEDDCKAHRLAVMLQAAGVSPCPSIQAIRLLILSRSLEEVELYLWLAWVIFLTYRRVESSLRQVLSQWTQLGPFSLTTAVKQRNVRLIYAIFLHSASYSLLKYRHKKVIYQNTCSLPFPK